MMPLKKKIILPEACHCLGAVRVSTRRHFPVPGLRPDLAEDNDKPTFDRMEPKEPRTGQKWEILRLWITVKNTVLWNLSSRQRFWPM